jgi:hypothetical protein
MAAALVLGGLIALTIATKGFTAIFSGDPSKDPNGGGPPPDQ